MRTQRNQLERMYDRLSPKERAILALQRWKADEEPDEALKRSTPQHDVKMVYGLLALPIVAGVAEPSCHP